MTKLREAAEMALGALEAHADIGIKSDKAIFALREALEQPEQEPVADTESDVLTATYMLGVHAGKKVANRQPLTDERYNELLMAVGRKFDGETRHETALRYIQQAEMNKPNPAHSIKTLILKDNK